MQEAQERALDALLQVEAVMSQEAGNVLTLIWLAVHDPPCQPFKKLDYFLHLTLGFGYFLKKGIEQAKS